MPLPACPYWRRRRRAGAQDAAAAAAPVAAAIKASAAAWAAWVAGGGADVQRPAEKRSGKLKVPTVCLDHGKREPRPAVPYQIKPLESYTTKPGVRELCQMLGNGQIDRRAAQAAAWHLNNDMTWQQLAAKRIRHANGTKPALLQPNRDSSGECRRSPPAEGRQQRRSSSRLPTPRPPRAAGRAADWVFVGCVAD